MPPPALLRAVVDRLVPGHGFPRASELGATEYVLQRVAEESPSRRREFECGLVALAEEAEGRHGISFDRMGGAAQDELLREVEQGRATRAWPIEPRRWFDQVLAWVAEAVYAQTADGRAGPRTVGLAIGYAPFDGVPSAKFSFAPGTVADGDETDVIIVGAGVAGGIVAGVLGATGKRVLVLERGGDAYASAARRDHLRNHRLSLYGHNTGPDLDGHPRVFVDAAGIARICSPHESLYHNNAAGVGGGGLVYGGMAWRFSPEDFRMASRYGTPAQSSLADWPLTYQDLEPYYERAEWEIGVAGEAWTALASPPRRGYPMPAHAGHPGRDVLARGAAALGWRTHGVPLLINSIERDGRPACARCNACVGFACPSDAKNGAHNTLLARALAAGNVTLVTGAAVARIDTDDRGHAVGVTYFSSREPSRRLRARARCIVVSGGAIESARLLLNSKSSREPRGLGNGVDQVGRHLQGHVYATACATMPAPVEDGRGPGPSIATSQFMHDNPEIIGGGLLSDDFVLLPIVAWRAHLPPRLLRWGAENQRFMTEQYRTLLKVAGPVQEIPNPESRVTLDPEVKDRFGMAVARLSGTVHRETVRAAEFLRLRAAEWLGASGAREVWSTPFGEAGFLSAGQHQAGTCRMGTDPRTSVTDSYGRVHGHDNVYVIDASLHVTNGGVNPVLTVMALALRNAESLAAKVT